MARPLVWSIQQTRYDRSFGFVPLEGDWLIAHARFGRFRLRLSEALQRPKFVGVEGFASIHLRREATVDGGSRISA